MRAVTPIHPGESAASLTSGPNRITTDTSRTPRGGDADRNQSIDLHNLLGVATLIWLFTVGLTGVINTLALPIFGHWQTTELAEMTARCEDAPAHEQFGSAECAVAAARAALPDSDLSFTAFPGNEFSTPHHYVAFMYGSTPLTSPLLMSEQAM